MLKSRIELSQGKPLLYIDGRPTAAMAYTTYFEERSRCEDFIAAGYRIFFVNVSFTRAPINSNTGFSPFRVGVFEDPQNPDYSEFEDAVRNILRLCPDAIIFPRIYISMPKVWVDAHPDDVVPTDKGGYREALFSDAFRRDGAEMLRRLIGRIKGSDYADRIGGWQITGGMTQEWFHHDYKGSLSPAALAPYRRWVQETYGEEGATLPSPEEFQYKGSISEPSENARRYSAFSNIGVAKTVEHFAGVIKNETRREQVVGSFYGYAYESNNCVTFGTHALRLLLDSPELDFFSSPNAYVQNRAFGIDWADMIPVDSVKHHRKLCFIECDIRTYLTTGMQEARPGEYPNDIYLTKNGKSVWAGPPTAELSREALRKCFAHQLTKASAIWWFDMWGGWYADALLMDDIAKMKDIYDRQPHCGEGLPAPEVVFFADERGYGELANNSPLLGGPIGTRTAMGNTGVPFDSCMVEDAPSVLGNYKAAVFAMPIPSEAGRQAMELCRKMGIPYISPTAERGELSARELCSFYSDSGVHFYADRGDVVYLGNGYIGLHSAEGGKKSLRLPRALTVTGVLGTSLEPTVTDCIEFELEKHTTALFSLA